MNRINGHEIPIKYKEVEDVLNQNLRISIHFKRIGPENETLEYHFIKKNHRVYCTQFRSTLGDFLRIGGTYLHFTNLSKYFDEPEVKFEKDKFKIYKVEVFPKEWDDYIDSNKQEDIEILKEVIALGVGKTKETTHVKTASLKTKPKIQTKVKTPNNDKEKIEELTQYLKSLEDE